MTAVRATGRPCFAYRVGAWVVLRPEDLPRAVDDWDGYHLARLLCAGRAVVLEQLTQRPSYDCPCEFEAATDGFTGPACRGPWYVVAGGFALQDGAVYAEHELLAMPDDCRDLDQLRLW